MDFNRLEGQYLVSRGIVSVETVEGALQLMKTQPARDLLECLTRQGLLDPNQAQTIRNEIQMHQSSQAFNAGSGLQPNYSAAQANALNQGSGTLPGAAYQPGSGLHPSYQQLAQTQFESSASSSSVIRTVAQSQNPILAGSGQIPVQHFQNPLNVPSSGYNPGLNQSTGMSSAANREYIAHYKIEKEIGRGGMGAVYQAYCSKLKRDVAIKTVTLDGVDASTALQRFQREAAAMARLSHPNIVTVHDFGDDNGVHYLVMDLIEGSSLKEIIQKQGHFDDKDAARLIMKLARALDYSHKHTILHRDIKPANVFVLEDGNEPLLGDFGLAKDTASEDQFNLTKSHQFLGTPVYMSPEQADGNAKLVDHRADIYSLGITLYEMLTGEVPFKGGNITNLVHAILTKDPEPPTKVRSEIDQDIESICLKCIEKDVMDRYWSAGALAEDLLNFLHDRPVRAKPLDRWEKMRRWQAKHTWATRGAVAALVVTLLTLITFTGYEYWSTRARTSEVQSLRSGLTTTAKLKHEELMKRLEEVLLTIPSGALDSDDKPARRRLREDLDKVEQVAKEALAFEEKVDWVEKPLGKLQELIEDFDSKRLRRLVREQFRPGYIASRAAYIKGQIYSKLDDNVRGSGERARAYKYDPTGFYGEKAYLEIATSLLAQEEYLSASPILKELAGEKHTVRVRARARLGLATIAINAGRFTDVLVLLDSKEDIDSLDASDQKIARWFTSLAKVYQGRGTWKRDQGLQVVFTPFEWEGCRIALRTLPWNMREEKRRNNSAIPIEICKARINGQKLEMEVIDQIGTDGPLKEFHFMGYKDTSYLMLRKKTRWTIYRFRNGRFVEDAKLRKGLIPRSFSPRLLGDFDGNNEPDLIVNWNRQRSRRVIFNFLTEDARSAELQGANGSFGLGGQAIDLNGDGADELVLTSGLWHHFCILAYKGQKGRQEFSKPVKKLIGESTGSLARHFPGQPAEVLITSNRRTFTDIGVLFGPDLSPDLPDAIWRTRMIDNEFVFEKVMTTKFEDRDQLDVADIHSNPILGKSYPNSFGVRFNEEGKQEFRFYSGIPSLPVVRIKGDYSSIRAVDLDLDGEPELLMNSYDEVSILGLKANAKRRRLEDIILNQGKTDQVTLAITLLEARRPRAAEQILNDVLSDKKTNTMTRIAASFAQARCFAARKEWALAREVCQDIARRYSSARKTAYLEAARFAEAGGNLEGCVRDLRQLLKVMPKRKDSSLRERILIERRLVALNRLTGMSSVITVNPKTLASQSESERSFESGPGIFSELKEDALVLSSRGGSPAMLSLPIRYTGESFRMKGKLRCRWLDGRSRFRVRFGEKDSDQNFLIVDCYVRVKGGDPLSWARKVELQYYRAKREFVKSNFNRSVNFRKFDTDKMLNFELFYREDERSLTLRVNYGSRSIERYYPMRRGLKSGAYQLQLELKDAPKRYKPIDKNSSRVEIYELSFEAPEGTLSIDRSVQRDPLAEAQFHFIRNDYTRSQDRALTWMADSATKSAKKRCEAAFLLALVNSRLGRKDAGLRYMKQAREASSKDFDKLWKDSLGLLRSGEHALLIEVLQLPRKGRALSQRMQRAVTARPPDWEYLALLHLGAGPKGMGHPEAGVAWLFSGHYELAEKVLKSPSGQKNPKVNFYLGVLAYKKRQYGKALDYWKEVDWKDRGPIGMYRDYSIRAEHLVQYSKK